LATDGIDKMILKRKKYSFSRMKFAVSRLEVICSYSSLCVYVCVCDEIIAKMLWTDVGDFFLKNGA